MYTNASESPVHTDMRISVELCTRHRKDLDYSALVRTEWKLEQSGLADSRLHCA
jgi:hypothetical protein